jgi:non-homologous end joining protein Ku
MADRFARSPSSKTTLVWGKMVSGVSLYKTTSPVREADFETERREPEPGGIAGGVLDGSYDSGGPVSVPASDGVGDPLIEREAERGVDLADLADMAAGSARPEAPPRREKPRKGIYRDDGTFLDLTAKLEAITEATQLDEMRIVGFVPSPSVPRLLVVGSYYVAVDGPVKGPLGEMHKVLAALERGLHTHRAAALVKWTKTSRQALGVLVASRAYGLVLLQLSWPEERVSPNPRSLSHRRVELTPEEETLAEELVAAMSVPAGAIVQQRDDAVTMRRNLRKAAESGLLDAWEAPSTPEREEVAGLEAALRESLPGAAR